MPLDTGFDAPAKLRTEWPATGPDSCGGRYCPGNDNPRWMDGYRTMWNGFGRSVNTYFVHLEEQIGPAAAVAMAKRLGISFRAPADAEAWPRPARTAGARSPSAWSTPRRWNWPGRTRRWPPAARTARRCRCRRSPTGRAPVGRRPAVPAGARPGRGQRRRRRGPLPGRPAGRVRPVRRRHRAQVAVMGGRPVAGKTGSTEDNTTETFVGFTPSAGRGRHRRRSGRPVRPRGQRRRGPGGDAVARTLRHASAARPIRTPTPTRALAFG